MEKGSSPFFVAGLRKKGYDPFSECEILISEGGG
jgi:hypothetical protein